MISRYIHTTTIGAATLTGLLFFGVTASAHHSVALQYDMTKEVTVTGAIVELEWRNPHAWLNLEVENEAGELELWKVEFGSANSLYRRGWRPTNLPVGSIVTVHGLPARDGSRSVDGEEVTLADGTRLLSGTNPDE
jgi:DNA/RNA endonuclease YhcR with UshA esterase domain